MSIQGPTKSLGEAIGKRNQGKDPRPPLFKLPPPDRALYTRRPPLNPAIGRNGVLGLQYLIYRYLLRKSHLVAKCDYFGARFKCKTEDALGRNLFKRGVHEKENTDYIIEHIKLNDGEIALDIGANIGWYSVLLSNIASDDARIFAFEPEPSNFDLLEHNLKKNECANVVAVNKGVSDKNGVMSLYLYPDKNRGRHSLIPDSRLREIEVDIVALDSFFSDKPMGKIRFLKIDIEGWEYFAFKGAQTLLAHVPVILMEYSPHLYNIGFTNDDLLDTLMDLSFRPHLIYSEGITEVDKKTLLGRKDQFDIFWVKRPAPVVPTVSVEPLVLVGN